MKKWRLIGIAAVLLAVLAGCHGSGTPTETSGNSAQAEGTASSSQAGAASSSESVSALEQQGEQAFTSLELNIQEGTLYIRAGDSFSLTRHNGDAVDYEIKDGVLYFADSRAGEAVLTLPEQDSYKELLLTVENGHVYVENPITLQNLKLEMDRGEAGGGFRC